MAFINKYKPITWIVLPAYPFTTVSVLEIPLLQVSFYGLGSVLYSKTSILGRGFPGGSVIKNLPTMQETRVRSLGQEDPLEKGMAIHCNILAWRIPWTEESGGLQSIGSQRVRHY